MEQQFWWRTQWCYYAYPLLGKKSLESFVLQFEVTKNLIVWNRTYEVVSKVDEALSSTAAISIPRFMWAIVKNVVLQCYGLGYHMVKNGVVQGLPRDIAKCSIFEYILATIWSYPRCPPAGISKFGRECERVYK
jgi:hypothetical protein